VPLEDDAGLAQPLPELHLQSALPLVQLLIVAPNARKRLPLNVMIQLLQKKGRAVAPRVADENGAAYGKQLVQLPAVECNVEYVLLLKSRRQRICNVVRVAAPELNLTWSRRAGRERGTSTRGASRQTRSTLNLMP
jgi:hypothetical protein